MPAIDLATCQAKLAFWLAAEEKLALGQRVAAEGRVLERANLAEVREQIAFWEQRTERASRAASGSAAGRPSIQRVISTRG